VTLGGGASTNVTLSVGTGPDDAGEYTATVSSADDSASASVTVLAPADFAVSIAETTTPVEGEQLNITAEITNTGDVETTQTIELSAGALGTDSTNVTLGGGTATNVTLGVVTGSGDAGEYTATVSSADDADTENVTVLAPANFAVSDLRAPTEAAPGALINVNATVNNTGSAAGEQVVEFRFDGTAVANTTVELNASESTVVEFTPTLPDQTGTFEHGVFTDDDNQTAQITVGESGSPNVTLSNLSVAGDGDTTTVTAGNYNVSVELSHDGGPDGAVPVELTLGNDTTSKTVSLNASETTIVTFENATGGLSPGVYNITVSAVNASVAGGVTLSVAVGGNTDPATDTDRDGLLEDIDGNGELTIFDVQTFLTNFEDPGVQDNAALFNFDTNDPVDIIIFDVQSLFLDLAG
jgi:CARDB.